MRTGGFTLRDEEMLRALISRLKDYTDTLEDANRQMTDDIIAAEEWFQGPNYDRFRQDWIDASTQISRFLGDAPQAIDYLEKVHRMVIDILDLR